MHWYYRNDQTRRWYAIEMDIARNGDMLLMQSWGGIGKRPSGKRCYTFKTLLEANDLRRRVHDVRIKHGYQLVEPAQLRLGLSSLGVELEGLPVEFEALKAG